MGGGGGGGLKGGGGVELRAWISTETYQGTRTLRVPVDPFRHSVTSPNPPPHETGCHEREGVGGGGGVRGDGGGGGGGEEGEELRAIISTKSSQPLPVDSCRHFVTCWKSAS